MNPMTPCCPTCSVPLAAGTCPVCGSRPPVGKPAAVVFTQVVRSLLAIGFLSYFIYLFWPLIFK